MELGLLIVMGLLGGATYGVWHFWRVGFLSVVGNSEGCGTSGCGGASGCGGTSKYGGTSAEVGLMWGRTSGGWNSKCGGTSACWDFLGVALLSVVGLLLRRGGNSGGDGG